MFSVSTLFELLEPGGLALWCWDESNVTILYHGGFKYVAISEDELVVAPFMDKSWLLEILNGGMFLDRYRRMGTNPFKEKPMTRDEANEVRWESEESVGDLRVKLSIREWKLFLLF